MKYRVVEVFDTDCTPWFRLQKSPDGEKWEFVSSGPNAEKLTEVMHRLAQELPPKVVAEFDTQRALGKERLMADLRADAANLAADGS